jgi:hypothetical protein
MTRKKHESVDAFEQILDEINPITPKLQQNSVVGFYKKLHLAKQEIGKAQKKATNPRFNSNYVDINGALDAIEPILYKHGLLLIQPITDNHVCSVVIDIDSGERLESVLRLPDLQDAQKVGSAITYYRRYTLLSLFSMQTEDDDGNKASEQQKHEFAWDNPKEILSDERFTNALKAISEGKSSKQFLTNKFALTQDQLKKVNAL